VVVESTRELPCKALVRLKIKAGTASTIVSHPESRKALHPNTIRAAGNLRERPIFESEVEFPSPAFRQVESFPDSFLQIGLRDGNLQAHRFNFRRVDGDGLGVEGSVFSVHGVCFYSAVSLLVLQFGVRRYETSWNFVYGVNTLYGQGGCEERRFSSMKVLHDSDPFESDCLFDPSRFGMVMGQHHRMQPDEVVKVLDQEDKNDPMEGHFRFLRKTRYAWCWFSGNSDSAAMCDTYGHNGSAKVVSYTFCASFAHVSLNVIVRLKTNLPGAQSLSSAK
jgi:hypothetical protein